jgi:hypothetical protein
MGNRLTVLIAVVALLAAVSLVIHDSFYTEIGIRPEDAGASDWDIVVRGVLFLGIPVAAATVAASGVLLAVAALTGPGPGFWPTVRIVAAVVLAALAAAAVALILTPGFRSFASGSFMRIVGAVVVLLALAAVLALVTGALGGGGGAFVAWVSIAIVLVAAVPALLLARSAGKALAEDARSGLVLDSGALDPIQVRAEPACILPQVPVESAAPTKTYVLLGESPAGAVVYDQVIKRAFRVAAGRLGVLGVADEVCRSPGDPVPVETGTPEEDAALARQFRPVLLFDDREPWRPLNIDRFLVETYGDAPLHHAACRKNAKCHPIRSSADLAGAVRLDLRGRASDGSDARMANCSAPAPLHDCESDVSAIYYQVRRQDRRVYVDYWWFLRYNHFPRPIGSSGICGGRATPLSQHQGDWEGVTVVTKFNQPRELDYVLYSAHGHSVRFRKLRPGLEDGRPKVYVACGSHAAYPAPCEGPRGCRQSSYCRPNPCRSPRSSLAEAPANGESPWHRNGDEECFDGAPCLLAFPGASDSWVTWPGRWGRKGGPRSPANQSRFSEPWSAVVSDRVSFDRSTTPGEVPENG